MNTVFSVLRSAGQPIWALLLLVVMMAPVQLHANGQPADHTLLLMGDSLSAAYGVESDTAWVSLLEARLDTKRNETWRVINASISGETTDGGARRLPDLLERHQPDLVIIELGGNDGLRGFQPEVIEQNLSQMIVDSRDAGARVMLIGMEIPPNYGRRYTELFASIYPKLADAHDTALVRFFLEGIYDQPGMMQADGIHPTGPAQPKLLDNVWPTLVPLLDQIIEATGS